MTTLAALEAYCNRLLDAGSFSDYCPNGVQVDAGTDRIGRLVTGVTASQALIDAALQWQADLLLVHHGFFWKGEPEPLTGIKGRRIRTLMLGGIGLLAYHLPLDAHPEFGNNRQLGQRLGLDGGVALEGGLLWRAELPRAESPEQLAARISSALQRPPLHLPGGPERIRRIGWCSGAAQSLIEQAAAAELDAFVSGEVSEQTMHLARELGIHYFAAGHHATERYGVQALGLHLAERYGLEHRFIELPNPV